MDAAQSLPEDRDEDGKSPEETADGPVFFADTESNRIAMESSQIGIWSWDIASNRIIWSSNLEAIHKLAEGSFDGSFTSFENDIHSEDRPAVLTALQDMLRTHNSRRLLYRLPPDRDSEEHWIESLATVVVEDDKVVRVVGTCRDVTDRAKVHRELRIRASQQEAVARLGERALVETDSQKFFEEAVETLAKILDVEFAKILELVPGDAELLLRAGIGWTPGLIGTAHETTGRESLAGFTLASGGPVMSESLAAETRFIGAPLLHQHAVVSSLSIPIAGRDGRAYGVLSTAIRN